MAKIGLFYGTQTGKTESIAEMIRDEFGTEAIDEDNQSDLTESRIKAWVDRLKREFT